MTVTLAASVHLSLLQGTLRLLAAAAIGAALGAEREWREHEAGIRTHMLVAAGSALFTLVSAYGFTDFAPGRWDPTRIAAQIVAGIGFLGAGTIMRVGAGIRGLTTAANLWVAAAAGLAVGAGMIALAIVGSGVALFALGPLRAATSRTVQRWRPNEAHIVIEATSSHASAILDRLGGGPAVVREVEIDNAGGRSRIGVWVKEADAHLLSELAGMEGVAHVSWQP